MPWVAGFASHAGLLSGILLWLTPFRTEASPIHLVLREIDVDEQKCYMVCRRRHGWRHGASGAIEHRR